MPVLHFEDEAGGMPQIQGQLGPYRDFHTWLDYRVRTCLKQINKREVLLFFFSVTFSPTYNQTPDLVPLFFLKQRTRQIPKSCVSQVGVQPSLLPSSYHLLFLLKALSVIYYSRLISALPALCLNGVQPIHVFKASKMVQQQASALIA